MNFFTLIFLIFAVLGALDYLIGNKFGLGGEFERGFKFFSATALSMIGIIILAPALAVWIKPFFELFYNVFKIDPSILPASIFANDMGGASLALEVAKNDTVGKFNAFVVSSMLGCIISFTIPFASGIVDKKNHKNMFLGFICGIVTVPVGCFVGGLMCGLDILTVTVDLLPVIIISVFFCLGLVFIPNLSLKVLGGFAKLLKVVIIAGFILGIISYLTGTPLPDYFDSFDEAADICVRISVTLSGAFPFVYVLGKFLKKPLAALGSKMGINSISALSLLSTLVTNATTFGNMGDMDKKGIVINSAFACSAAYILGSHLAFTSAMAPELIGAVIVSKLISGASAVGLAVIITSRSEKSLG